MDLTVPQDSMLVAPAAGELNRVTTVNQRRCHPPSCASFDVRGGRFVWGKRPAHSATGPGYCARRAGLTPAMAVAHDLTRRATLA
ncbi:hypothetical protein GCM10023080_079480 [Streptomyces pseudoechinosporeus]